ncbi:hypothetical protein [Modestobacter sp. I12A-02662]|uniref:hypothetical protein n=1 Tax=Modestobacter sp. I12A-02662 TaxID=1730496 RepID=UPI0034DEF0BA
MRALKLYGTLLAVTAVPFGLFLGLPLAGLFALAGIGAGAVEGLLTGLGGGVVFGVLMALVLGTAQLFGVRGVPRGRSLSPRQERRVPVPGGPGLPDRVVSALRSLPADVTAADVATGRFVARRRASWKSWGEEVVVQLTGDPAHPTATVSSRPVLGTTLVDAGRGHRNVEHVVPALGG